MIRTLVAFALALVPAAAGAGASAPPKPLALTAAPARLAFRGSGEATVRIRNAGTKRLVVDAALAGFSLDLRGRPHIAAPRGARSAAPWLAFRPVRLTLGPRASARLRVSASVPPHAEPGDHDALVLLTARPLADARVSVRLRLGVVAVVRAPGTVVRRLRLGRLWPARRGAKRVLELVVVNAGNVTERLRRVRVVMSGGTLAAGARGLRPQTRGVLEFRLRMPVHGRETAHVVVPAEPGRPAIRRTYRLRL